jgi:hypothetical protein
MQPGSSARTGRRDQAHRLDAPAPAPHHGKEQIRDQVVSASPLPGDGIAWQLVFVVGPRRAWPNLWKATIDALGPILGRDDGAREWNACAGRLVDLGFVDGFVPRAEHRCGHRADRTRRDPRVQASRRFPTRPTSFGVLREDRDHG